MLKFALVVGTSRPCYFADMAVDWILARAKSADFRFDVIDAKTSSDRLLEKKLATFDGFLLAAAEFRGEADGSLANGQPPRMRKGRNRPIGFVGYGAAWRTRSLDAKRLFSLSLKMAPVPAAVPIPYPIYLEAVRYARLLGDYPQLNQALDEVFTQLLRWARASKAARSQGPPIASVRRPIVTRLTL